MPFFMISHIYLYYSLSTLRSEDIMNEKVLLTSSDAVWIEYLLKALKEVGGSSRVKTY